MTLFDLEQKLSQNPTSPLFARLAMEYLATGRVREAKHLCLIGLQQHRSYATAHLILARCFHAEQHYRKALGYIEEARRFLPDSTYLKTLRDEWMGQAREHPDMVVAKEPEIAPVVRTHSPEISKSPGTAALHGVPVDNSPIRVPPASPFAAEEMQRSEQILTETIQHAPPTHVDTLLEFPATPALLEAPSPADGGIIVSKTLAEIYASQGAYAEAILTYRLLKQRRPGQTTEIDRRIKELEPKLQEKRTS